ncbi:MAG: glycoside hydrolase family 5 protein [Chitinophagaceae bacterium]|nr:glycoside hydrolase family 5 protein [Chitinophagaceae bacterium]
MIRRILLFYFLLFFVFANHVFSQKGFVYRDGENLRDYAGRMILLRGLNYVNKDEKNNYRNLIKDTAFIKMKSWGFNAVRLGINWSALEPSPGKYDTDYLQDLDLRLQYAKQYGIYVILDMHQDLYGKKFGGGAPLWATLDEGKPHITGGIWSDAYFISPAVQTSFDNFWNNALIAGGMGVQDHYIKTWAMLAQRYRNDKNIIGFDLMNEPFIGSAVNDALAVMINEVTLALNEKSNGKKYTPEEVGEMWMDEQGKSEIIKMLTGKDVFLKVLSGMEPVYKYFEENKLMPFYKKLAIAIRQVNKNHILFWEPSVSSNNGIPTHIEPIAEAGNQQAYMPHFYDIVLDTKDAGKADSERLMFMFGQLQNSKSKLNLPLLIGEWGAFYGGDQEVVDAAKFMANGIDSFLFGDFYWDYFSGLEQQEYFKKVLLRPYMQAATGKIIEQKAGNNFLNIKLENDKRTRGNNIIFIPTTKKVIINNVAKYKQHLLNGGKGSILEISPDKKLKSQTIRINW